MIKFIGVGVLMAASFVAGTLVPVASMQQTPGAIQGSGEFVVIDYMKVPPGKGADYVAMERNFYKASHQARIKDGKLKSWGLLQLRFAGPGDYSYATINTYRSWADIDASLLEYVQRANPGKDSADIQRQTLTAREMTRSEVWRVLEQVQ
jgi:hypothetical protein